MEKANTLEAIIIKAQGHIDECVDDREWMTIDEAEKAWIEGASILFNRMNQMSVDDIICHKDDEEGELSVEEFDHPLSDREATQYFQSRGVLSMSEVNSLMQNKLKELWRNECSDEA